MPTTVLNTKFIGAEIKIQNTNNSVITTALNTKIYEAENKILDHGKYNTTPEFNQLQHKILTKTKIKQNI